MTIAVAVRTQTAVVFAADSKLTTRGFVGLDQDGKPRWATQTYDNATKVVQSHSGCLMGMVAGAANIGRMAATDYLQVLEVGEAPDRARQDQRIQEIVGDMVGVKRAYFEPLNVQPADWPGPTMLLAAPTPGEHVPRVWRVNLEGEASVTEEILTDPFVRFEGAYDEVFGLLVGFHGRVLGDVAQQLGLEPQRLYEAMGNLHVPRPMDEINFASMPLQDAMDLAVFLATVQIEMDRFTPGIPACGGPIDVMALQAAPTPRILWYPGKTLHHPLARGTM